MQAIPQYGYWLPQKQPRELGRHRNPGLEIIYIARGEMLWECEGKPVPVTARTLFFTLPWQRHGSMTRDLPGNEVYWVVLALDSKYRTKPACFRLHADLRMGSEAEHDILMTVAAAPSPVVKGAALLGQVVQDLIQEVCKPCQLGHDQMVRSLAQRLVIELARRIRTGEQLSSKPTSIDRVRRFLAGLSDECDSQWSLEEMASSCGMGRTQFASLVKDLTGDNPVQHLNRLRIQNAERLLAASDQSIIDIAFACGFATSQYFATVFKAFAGMDPTTWRRHNRADVHTHDPSTLPG